MRWTVRGLGGGPRRVNHSAVAVKDIVYSFGGKDSHLKSIFYPIYILKIPIFTKFTFHKYHFSQNSPFVNLIFHKIHIS